MIQEPNDESFIVYLNGEKQNNEAQAQIHLTNLNPGSCQIKIICAGITIINESIELSSSIEYIYEIRKKTSYNSPSHFLKRISAIPINSDPMDDRGTTSASYNDLANAIKGVKSQVFFATGFSTKDAWENRMLSQASSMKYYDCLAEQITTIVSLKSKVFFAEGTSTKADWARRMVEKIMSNPIYDCKLAEKMKQIVNRKNQSGAFGPSGKANWARRQLGMLLQK